jgi:exodeoxyribonuclease VII small subunit
MKEGDGEKQQDPSFAVAMNELEQILRRVEGEEIDIDQLALELNRAATLLELCRAKIRRAEVEVSQIAGRLEARDGEEGG